MTRTDASFITQLENKRWAKWRGSIRRIRHVPYGSKKRAQMMLATQCQASFAQGTHGLAENREYLKQVDQIPCDHFGKLMLIHAFRC